MGRFSAMDVVLSWPVVAIHLLALTAWWWSPPGWSGLALWLGSYVAWMVVITAGYHRYFSHRAFHTSRAAQFALAWLATTTLQRGVIGWAARHRAHHQHSDTERDPHSPRHGLYWSHIGWTLARTSQDRDDARVRDWLAVPELVWLERMWLLPSLVLLAGLAAVGGLHAVAWGFLVPLVTTWHASFTVNSVAHLWGSQPFDTGDDARNNLAIALLTMGEGWHNNHHRFPSSARQGHSGRQPDATWIVLRVAERLGLIWDVRRPPTTTVPPP